MRPRHWIYTIPLRLRSLFRGREVDQELDEELQFHIEQKTHAYVEQGMDPAAARRRALRDMHGIEQSKEECREMRRVSWLLNVVQDVRFGARMLAKNTGFTLVALLTLALGIGANAVMFSVVHGVLLRSLPYPDADRILFAYSSNPAQNAPIWGTSPPDYYAMRAENRSFTQLAASYNRSCNLTGDGEPERLRTSIISSEYFDVLGIQAQLGRVFALEDETWGAHRVVVVSDSLWRRRFGADPDLVGRSLRLNGEAYQVVGVMRSGFAGVFSNDVHLWVPMSFAPGDNMNTHNNYFLTMLGRLKPAISPEQARDDLAAIAAGIARQFPENRDISAGATPLRERIVGNVRLSVLVLQGAVGIVLLIACANLVNLLLARATARRKEIAVRAALGATRPRLLGQFFTESTLLALLGGFLGLLVAAWSMGAVHMLGPNVLPRAGEVRLDSSVLLFTLGVSLLTGILFGMIPAVQSSALDLHSALKEGGRTGQPSGTHRGRAFLVIAQVALSMVLLIGAGLMLKSLGRLFSVNPGFNASGVLTMQMSLPRSTYIDADLERAFNRAATGRAAAFIGDVMERVRHLPGVKAAAFSTALPLGGDNWAKNVTLHDRPLPAHASDLPPFEYRVVAGDFFRTLGVPILKGRAFDDRDALGGQDVVIVSEEFARRYWSGAEPLGKVISVNAPPELLPAGTLPPGYQGPEKFTVVGVAADVRYAGLRQPQGPVVYVPYSQGAEGVTDLFLLVRTDGDPMALAGAVRDRVWQVDRQQPVTGIAPLQDRVSAAVAQPRLQTGLLALFAALATVLAAIGTYGVMSYSVAQRSHEMGVRMALGAQPRHVFHLVVGHGFWLAIAGVGIGLAAALPLTRLLSTFLFQVSPTDPWTYASVATLLTAVALAACYWPARRAARVDPMVVLRHE